uniref:Uncharacterized protein n=1 Tax=Arundo donax TaxID=35708 RepID=A0A0A8Z998_ARUDO
MNTLCWCSIERCLRYVKFILSGYTFV